MANKDNKQTLSDIKTTTKSKAKKEKKVKDKKPKKVKEKKQKPVNIVIDGSTTFDHLNFNEYKQIIDIYATTNSLHKFRLRDDYFDVCQNYWLIDKYIAKYGLYTKDEPANSIGAFNNAIKENYPVTISVQMLKDGTLVCYSEKSLAHLGMSGYLNNCMYDDIKDLGILGTTYTIPTFQEVLDTIKNQVEIVVDIINEINCGKMEEIIVNMLSRYIDKYDCYGRVAVMSANPNSLTYCCNNFPYITRILKVSNFKDPKYAGFDTKKLSKLKYYKQSKADFIAYPHNKIPYWRLKHIKTRGLLAMSVKTQEEYMRVSKYCDNIIFSEFEPKI